MKKIKEKIDVEVWNIEADERYYSFEYVVKRKGEVVEEGSYESDYENGNTPAQMIEDLKDGYAVELAIIQAFG